MADPVTHRPRLLDLCCGGGGASVGYHRAGFDVTGVDIVPRPAYPFTFYQADALTFPLDGFDAVHASPPCQAFTRAGALRAAQGGRARSGDLLTPMLERLAPLSIPWIVENVPGAPMPDPLILCGSMFGLAVRRHRAFSSNRLLLRMDCRHELGGRPVGVYHVLGDEIPNGGRTAATLDQARAAMGIDWLEWDELKEAIPPAYTEHLGAQILPVTV